jgi:hypothetical protein
MSISGTQLATPGCLEKRKTKRERERDGEYKRSGDVDQNCNIPRTVDGDNCESADVRAMNFHASLDFGRSSFLYTNFSETAMSSSFLGLTVQVQLQSGGTVKGKIINIDTATGTLGILQSDARLISVTRGEIADLKMVSESAVPESVSTSAAPTAAPARPAGSVPGSNTPQSHDPAIISLATEAKKAIDLADPLSTNSPVLTPRGPAAPLDLSTGISARSRKPKDSRKLLGANMESSSKTNTEDERELEGLKYGKKKQGKSKKKVQQRETIDANEPDLGEDFDFDKALRSFDKSKIWQEIRVS